MTSNAEKSNRKVRVLYFVDRMLHGGIQTFVLKNWEHMNHKKVQIDFLLLDDGNNYELDDALRQMGSTVYKLESIWIRRPWDYFSYCKALDIFFQMHHDYQIVHLHSSSKNFPVLMFAKKYGVSTRIAHSHNTDFQTESVYRKIAGNLFKPMLIHYSTDFFACSQAAGKWLFGNSNVTIVKNGVDTEQFSYDRSKAQEVRKQFGIQEDEIVIGHVGRFTHQKNHTFLIEIFKAVYDRNKRYRLLLVGSGELESKIREKVQRYGLENAVIFAGYQMDTGRMMQAMDLFVFPSVYEGLGLVLIEAQAAGLPCLTSQDVVPMEARVCELLNFVPLQNNPEDWAEKIIEVSIEKRPDMRTLIMESGYDIRKTAMFLQDYYLKKGQDKD